MSDLITEILQSDRVSLVQKEVRKRKEFLGTVLVRKGQILWELNLKTLEIIPAIIDHATVNINGMITRNVITKEDCLYCVAINSKNALRKFLLMIKNITKEIRSENMV